MEYKNLINKIFETLEKEHINLYHDISKEEFEKQKSKFIAESESLDELHFEAGMRRLFALFKDAHTNFFTQNNKPLDMKIISIDKDFYVDNNGKYEKIEAINNVAIDEVVEKLSKLIAYEAEEWLYSNLEVYLCSIKYLAMIDIAKLEDNHIIVHTSQNNLSFSIKIKSEKQYKYYSYSKKDDLLYISYPICEEKKDYPFKDFLNDIINDCDTLPGACLIDVRGNFGGYSTIITPLIDWLERTKIQTFVLMDKGTASSSIFALADCKKRLNATLLGTHTGGTSAHYGYVKNLSVDKYSFSCSISYFDFSNIFGYTGAIKPDIEIKQSIKELNKGNDYQLEQSLEYIKTTPTF